MEDESGKCSSGNVDKKYSSRSSVPEQALLWWAKSQSLSLCNLSIYDAMSASSPGCHTCGL